MLFSADLGCGTVEANTGASPACTCTACPIGWRRTPRPTCQSILWFGRNYHDVDHDTVRHLRGESLSHDNLFHTLLGLFEIDSSVYDRSKDLLQKSRDLSQAAP